MARTVGELQSALNLYPAELEVRMLIDMGTGTIEQTVASVVDSSEWIENEEPVVYLSAIT
jgi:hypothetical protein